VPIIGDGAALALQPLATDARNSHKDLENQGFGFSVKMSDRCVDVPDELATRSVERDFLQVLQIRQSDAVQEVQTRTLSSPPCEERVV
jgi:hypothetical protein